MSMSKKTRLNDRPNLRVLSNQSYLSLKIGLIPNEVETLTHGEWSRDASLQVDRWLDYIAREFDLPPPG